MTLERIYEFFSSFFVGISLLLLQIFLIILALLITIEILTAFHIVQKINHFLYRFTHYIGISESGSLPLFIGLLAGITYGAGSIIASYQNKEMTKKDVLLVSVFMCLCHALIEDTLIFVALGANGWLLIFTRLILAIILTLIVYQRMQHQEKKQIKEINEVNPL